MEIITVQVDRGRGWEKPFEMWLDGLKTDEYIETWLIELAQKELDCSGDAFREILWNRKDGEVRKLRLEA